MPRRLAPLVALGVAMASGQAEAEPAVTRPLITCVVGAPAPCMVVTRSRAAFVGQLASLSPDSWLILTLPTQETRAIPTADIISAAPVAPPGPTSASGQQDGPVAAAIDGVAPPMRIELRPRGLASEAPWGVICQAPCPTEPINLYRSFQYRLFDPSGLGSPEFAAPSESRAVTLRVRPGHLGRRRGGLALMVLGSLLTAVAVPVAYLYAPNKSTTSPDQALAGQLAMGAAAGLGVPALAAGITLFVLASNRVQLVSPRAPGE